MLGRGQSILAGDIELVKAHIVEEHIDAAQVIGGDVDLLPKEAIADGVSAQHLFRLQQQGAGTAGGIVDFVNLCLAHGSKAGQQLGHIGGREELAAGFSCVGGVHGHEIFIGIAKGIDVMILHVAQIHVRHAVQQLDQLFIAFGHCRAQFVAVHVIVVKQARKAAFGLAALGGFLDMTKNRLQRLVQIFILGRVLSDIAE